MAYYKYYTPNEHSLRTLKDNQIFFAHPSLLNDSFDTSDKLLKEYSDFCKTIGWSDELSDKLNKHAVFSMTREEQPNNRHLWSLYAGNYSGFAVEFANEILMNFTRNNCLYISQVQYRDKPLNLNDNQSSYAIPEHEESRSYQIAECSEGDRCEIAVDRLFEFLHLQKEKRVWDIECEARIIIGNNIPHIAVSVPSKGYKMQLPDGCIKSLILGCNMLPKHRDKLRKISKILGCCLYMAEPKIIDGQWDVLIMEIK